MPRASASLCVSILATKLLLEERLISKRAADVWGPQLDTAKQSYQAWQKEAQEGGGGGGGGVNGRGRGRGGLHAESERADQTREQCAQTDEVESEDGTQGHSAAGADR